MNSDEFIAHVDIPDIHDESILRVSVDRKTAEFVLGGFS
jgi:hypothetical protein